MGRKKRFRARVNTGLNWFFEAYEPGLLEGAAGREKKRREKEDRKNNPKKYKTKPSSTNPKKLARLRKRKAFKEGKLKLKQLKA